jgi:hypothetical protein
MSGFSFSIQLLLYSLRSPSTRASRVLYITIYWLDRAVCAAGARTRGISAKGKHLLDAPALSVQGEGIQLADWRAFRLPFSTDDEFLDTFRSVPGTAASYEAVIFDCGGFGSFEASPFGAANGCREQTRTLRWELHRVDIELNKSR